MHKRPLHICIVTAEFPALTETFITNKVLALRKLGHHVSVIKNSDHGIVNASHLALVKEANVEVNKIYEMGSVGNAIAAIIHHPFSFLQSLSPNRANIKAKFTSSLQLKLLNNTLFDIIHFEFSGLAVNYIDTIKELKAKTVVSCRGTAEKVKPLTDKKRKEKLKSLFNVVDAIHCVSHDMASTVTALGASKEKIFVNTPAVDTNVFTRTGPYKQHDALNILTVGRFTFQKGYMIGLMAMVELKQKGISFKWLIVGDGPQLEEITYHIHALGLEEEVQLLGKKNRDEILSLYNDVDVFLLSSVYEGIANVCLEAMAMELPVITTKSGGMEEVIVHGQNGLLANVYDPIDLAKQVERVAKDFELRKLIGVNGRQTVSKEFSLQKQAEIFEAKYYELLNIK